VTPEHQRRMVATRKQARVLVDGQLIAPVADELHGVASTYANHVCRCDRCIAAHRVHMRQHLPSRHLVNGRLVAVVPPERHGHTSTYAYWGCRCEACTKAVADYSRQRRNRESA
jgi:hypothetical protein